MNDVAHDGASQGEIVVRTPWLTQGYLGEPEKSEDLWRGGWLHTGDVGVIDADGYVKIVDRIKDVVKTGGEWVSSLDLEDIILRMPGIAEVAVVGMPDERWGERPVALVVLKPGQGEPPSEGAIRLHVDDYAQRGAISKYAVPDRVHFVDAIPKTSVGKLDKKVIRANLQSDAARGEPRPSPTASEDTMSQYRAPLAEMQFVMTELAGLDEIAEIAGLRGRDTRDRSPRSSRKPTSSRTEVLDPLNRIGDQQGARLEADGRVTTPPGFRDAYRKFCELGWNGLSKSADFGGQGMPQLVAAAIDEMWNAANMAFELCPMLTSGAIEAIELNGSDALKEIYLPKMVSGEWTGTMNLTEPQAGSDLAAVRSKAVRQADGSYVISGNKIFITYGDHDYTDNIVHLVLARTPDAPPGTKGISLFVVPKFIVNADGSLGRRNDVALRVARAQARHPREPDRGARLRRPRRRGGPHRRRGEPRPRVHVRDDESRPLRRRHAGRRDRRARLSAGARLCARSRAGPRRRRGARRRRRHHRPPGRPADADDDARAHRSGAGARLCHRGGARSSAPASRRGRAQARARVRRADDPDRQGLEHRDRATDGAISACRCTAAWATSRNRAPRSTRATRASRRSTRARPAFRRTT